MNADLKHGALFVACMLMALVTFLTSTGLTLEEIWSIFK